MPFTHAAAAAPIYFVMKDNMGTHKHANAHTQIQTAFQLVKQLITVE
jgi:hypothetical protein